jgi:hypothetical protein
MVIFIGTLPSHYRSFPETTASSTLSHAAWPTATATLHARSNA